MPGRWADADDIFRLPGYKRYALGALSVLNERHDPEDTMTLAVTHSELALITFSNMVTATLFPEVAERVVELNGKLIELSEAQAFLPWEPGEADDTLGRG
jgi:hypothetical protein